MGMGLSVINFTLAERYFLIVTTNPSGVASVSRPLPARGRRSIVHQAIMLWSRGVSPAGWAISARRSEPEHTFRYRAKGKLNFPGRRMSKSNYRRQQPDATNSDPNKNLTNNHKKYDAQ
jgi:hypothetical protein